MEEDKGLLVVVDDNGIVMNYCGSAVAAVRMRAVRRLTSLVCTPAGCNCRNLNLGRLTKFVW